MQLPKVTADDAFIPEDRPRNDKGNLRKLYASSRLLIALWQQVGGKITFEDIEGKTAIARAVAEHLDLSIDIVHGSLKGLIVDGIFLPPVMKSQRRIGELELAPNWMPVQPAEPAPPTDEPPADDAEAGLASVAQLSGQSPDEVPMDVRTSAEHIGRVLTEIGAIGNWLDQVDSVQAAWDTERRGLEDEIIELRRERNELGRKLAASEARAKGQERLIRTLRDLAITADRALSSLRERVADSPETAEEQALARFRGREKLMQQPPGATD